MLSALVIILQTGACYQNIFLDEEMPIMLDQTALFAQFQQSFSCMLGDEDGFYLSPLCIPPASLCGL